MLRPPEDDLEQPVGKNDDKTEELAPYVPGSMPMRPPNDLLGEIVRSLEVRGDSRKEKTEDLSNEQATLIRSVSRLVRKYIKFDGEHLVEHRKLKDNILAAIQHKDLNKLSALICSFADVLCISDQEQLAMCKADADRAFRAVTTIDETTIPWQLFYEQIEIAIGDALSGAMDRLSRTGIIDVKEIKGTLPDEPGQEVIAEPTEGSNTMPDDGQPEATAHAVEVSPEQDPQGPTGIRKMVGNLFGGRKVKKIK